MLIARSSPKPLIWKRDASRAEPYRFSRRKEERLSTVEDRLWVQWSENGECLGAAARLVNVSRGGAMLLSPRVFKVDQVIQLFLEFAEPEIHGKAKVLGVLEGKHGFNQVRVAFVNGCPEAFFQAAAFGFEAWLGLSRSHA